MKFENFKDIFFDTITQDKGNDEDFIYLPKDDTMEKLMLLYYKGDEEALNKLSRTLRRELIKLKPLEGENNASITLIPAAKKTRDPKVQSLIL
jgi:hypothetical protein